MEPIYVFGHKNPDTDSVVSAMAYAALGNALGEGDYIPARLGHLNDETAFLLQRFGFEQPLHLHSVRTQVHDIDYDRPPRLSAQVPISHAWATLHQSEGLSALPVTDEDGHLYGMVTAGGIAENDMDSIQHPQVKDVPIFNLLSALEGRIINDEDQLFDTISGEVTIALPGVPSAMDGMPEGAIWICGEQKEMVERALSRKASCIILCQSNLAESYRGLNAPTCMIATPCDAYRAARMIYQSVPVSRVAQTQDLVYFHLDDYIDDVRDMVLQSRYRSYPILDADEKVVGTLSRYHLLRPRRKRVVLMDHNEKGQSVPGLEQAEIIAIIDHHRLADVQTGNPVFMRNEPIGSTTSIVASMYQERGLLPSPKLAGLMAAAILSDTVLFKSPTCTARDRRLAERLARIAGLDLDVLGREMYSVGKSTDKPAVELLRSDFKEFHIGGHNLAISQVTCLNADDVLPRLPEFLSVMEKQREDYHYDMVMLMLTDVLREGTELIFVGDEEIIRNAFAVEDVHDQHVFLPHVVSRKKQIVPALAVLWG